MAEAIYGDAQIRRKLSSNFGCAQQLVTADQTRLHSWLVTL